MVLKTIALAIIVAQVVFAHVTTMVTAKGKFKNLSHKCGIEMYLMILVYILELSLNCNINILEKKLRKIIGVAIYFSITRMLDVKKS